MESSLLKKISYDDMEVLHGGGVVDGLCIGIGSASIVYTIGGALTITNWWNPVGWVSATFIVADIACLAYVASQQK